MNLDSTKAEAGMGFAQWCGLLALLAAVGICWQLRELLIQLFGAVVLAIALSGLVDTIQKRLSISRWQCLVVAIFILSILAGLVAYLLLPPFIEQFSELINQVPRAATYLAGLSEDILVKYGQQDNINISGGIRPLIGIAGNLGTAALQTLFVMALSLMFSAQPKSYFNVLVSLAPSFYRKRFSQVLGQCAISLKSWMFGVVISCLCVAILAFIGLSLLGIKLTIANSILAGLLNVIPNLGPTIGTIFPMSVALLQSPWKAVAVLALYFVIQNFESYLITPSVMHHQLKLLPGLTLAAQVGFTLIFGPLGLLLALPLAVCLQVFIRDLLINDFLDCIKQPLKS
jgi:predicted PurR-regulated permease PerM